jgi:hypothetical protein
LAHSLTKIALQRHGEALVLCARAVIRKAQRLIDQGITVNGRITMAWFLLQDASLDEQWRCFDRFHANLKQCFRDLDPAIVPDGADREPWIVHVHENAGGTYFHTHFALAVPPGFLAGFRDAVRGIARRSVDGYCVNRSSGKLVKVEVRRPDAHACTGQWNWFHYMLKGTRRDEVLVETGPDGTRLLDDVLAWRYENPGPARPRRPRVRVTPNLNGQAQCTFVDERGAFVSLWDKQVRSGRVDVRTLYSDHYLLQARGELDQGHGGR